MEESLKGLYSDQMKYLKKTRFFCFLSLTNLCYIMMCNQSVVFLKMEFNYVEMFCSFHFRMNR